MDLFQEEYTSLSNFNDDLNNVCTASAQLFNWQSIIKIKSEFKRVDDVHHMNFCKLIRITVDLLRFCSIRISIYVILKIM